MTGVNAVSLAGGAEVTIYGQGMSHTPSLITGLFSNPTMGGTFQGGPPKARKCPKITEVFNNSGFIAIFNLNMN